MREANPLNSPEQSLLYRPASIVDPMDLTTLFPCLGSKIPHPLELELGSGDGSFLIDWAASHRDCFFLGIERMRGRLIKIDRKGRKLGLPNVKGMRMESAYLLEYLLPPQCLSAIHIYFPDPWPKRKHEDRRLVNTRFPSLSWRVLEAGGTVYMRTDYAPYFEQMKEVFSANTDFEPVETPQELAAFTTDFERAFLSKGIPTLRAAYRKKAK